MGLLLVAALLCRVIWLPLPRNGLIFDETYYVNAARVILGWHVPSGAAYADATRFLDPNQEHPPLAKLLMAGSMLLFGDNAVGWRLPSIIAGMFSIVLLYRIVVVAAGHAWLGVLAATIFAFDNMVLVHSRIGTLDMMQVVCMLAATWLWFEKRPMLAGVACGAATMMKIGGVYAFAALILLELLRTAWEWRNRGGTIRPDVRVLATLSASFVATWVAGMWILDLWVTRFWTPWDHLGFILKYGFGLTRARGPANIESYPWQWMINDVQIPYFRADQNILVNGKVTESRPTVWFRGAMNPILIGAAPLAMAYSLWRAYRLGELLSLWVVAWIICNYLTFYPTSMIAHRISYIFYFLPTIPAVAVALAQLLREAALPRLVTYGYLFALLIGFIGYFPFRTLQP
jgi:predicted membrane-bound dolichyl-phosphate-mannose-protein mannosyltransferase